MSVWQPRKWLEIDGVLGKFRKLETNGLCAESDSEFGIALRRLLSVADLLKEFKIRLRSTCNPE